MGTLRLVLILMATTSAIFSAHPIDDFINCLDDSCKDACDTTWLKYTPEVPETPATKAADTSPPTAKAETTTALASTTTRTLPTDPVTIPGELTNLCHDGTYMVPLFRTVIMNGKVGTWSFVPTDRTEMLAAQKRIGFKTDYYWGLYTAGCVISMDRVWVLERKCPNATQCLAPLCHTVFRDNGRLQYRLVRGEMPAKCPPGGEVVGYAITKYDCCGAIAPVNELWRVTEGYPDYWLEIGDGNGKWPVTDGYRNWKSIGLPFFSWPVVSKSQVEVCPDRKYMVPIVRAWGIFGSNSANHFYYYFLMDDTSEYEADQKAGDIRIQWLWRTGCAIKKDGLEELGKACPDYKNCVKPLCSTRAKHPVRTNLPVYRLETADWTEPLCPRGKHIGYIPATPGCCGANALLQTMVRSTPVPGYFYSPLSADIYQSSGWTYTTLKDFYIWPTIPLLR